MKSAKLLACLLLVATVPLTAKANSTTVDDYITVFKGSDWQQEMALCNKMQWMGISDTRLFDVIEADLVALYPTAKTNQQLDQASWLAKTLGISGNEKYRPTLTAIINGRYHKKLKKYANEGLTNLSEYRIWNPIISDTKEFRSDKSVEINNFANMLRSNEWRLMKIAATRISYDKITDKYLISVLNDALLNNYQRVSGQKAELESVVRMSRALASAGHPEYKSSLEQIAQSDSHPKVKKFARKAIRKYM